MPQDSMQFPCVSKQALLRLPMYLNHLKAVKNDGVTNISSPIISKTLKLNEVQVRKDLALVSSGGRPKTGYVIEDLINDIEVFLGYDNINEAVLVGAGQLGKALLSYKGFEEYGLNIVAAFDNNQSIENTCVNGKQILNISKLSSICSRLKVHLGIIAVPSENAQEVCDMLIASGVLAIWNFSPTHLVVPPDILVQNENMASSLAILSNHLMKKISSPKLENKGEVK